MRELLYLLLGWLLGVLSPFIAERIHRKHRQQDFVSSVVIELGELQYILAAVAFKMRSKVFTLTDKFLDWLLPIVSSYSGPGKNPTLAATLTKLREGSEDQRRQALTLMRDEGRGFTLKRYEVPFLVAQASELSICSLDFQRRVFRVKSKLDLFNQHVSYLQGQFEKTFDASIVGANRDVVERNLTEGYASLATFAEETARAIGEIISRYGSP